MTQDTDWYCPECNSFVIATYEENCCTCGYNDIYIAYYDEQKDEFVRFDDD